MVRFRTLERPTSFRKLAASMWRAPNDPHIFGSVDIDMTAALAFMERYGERFGCKVTVTHLVVRAVALVLHRYPELNAKVTWRRLAQRTSVEVFCQVASEDGRDLSGLKLPATDTLSLADIAARLGKGARDIRGGDDPAFRRSRGLFSALPLWGVRLVLRLMDLLCNRLGLDLPKAGLPADPFGSAMVTSVGMHGVDSGFAPFTPVARCPMIVTITRIKPRPWVVGERVEPRPVLRLCGTFDHRIIDGFSAGKVSGAIEALLEDPRGLLTDSERATFG